MAWVERRGWWAGAAPRFGKAVSQTNCFRATNGLQTKRRWLSQATGEFFATKTVSRGEAAYPPPPWLLSWLNMDFHVSTWANARNCFEANIMGGAKGLFAKFLHGQFDKNTVRKYPADSLTFVVGNSLVQGGVLLKERTHHAGIAFMSVMVREAASR